MSYLFRLRENNFNKTVLLLSIFSNKLTKSDTIYSRYNGRKMIADIQLISPTRNSIIFNKILFYCFVSIVSAQTYEAAFRPANLLYSETDQNKLAALYTYTSYIYICAVHTPVSTELLL